MGGVVVVLARLRTRKCSRGGGDKLSMCKSALPQTPLYHANRSLSQVATRMTLGACPRLLVVSYQIVAIFSYWYCTDSRATPHSSWPRRRLNACDHETKWFLPYPRFTCKSGFVRQLATLVRETQARIVVRKRNEWSWTEASGVFVAFAFHQRFRGCVHAVGELWSAKPLVCGFVPPAYLRHRHQMHVIRPDTQQDAFS